MREIEKASAVWAGAYSFSFSLCIEEFKVYNIIVIACFI